MKVFPVTTAAIVAVVFVAVAGSVPTARAEEWMLMGREGGCVTLAQAAERRPVLSGITTPDQLVARLRERGEEVSRKDLVSQDDVTVVQVDAPGLNLDLIFAPPALCP
jgi:hypothetical protein